MERINESLFVKRGNTNVGVIEYEGKRYLIDTGSNEKFAKEISEEVGRIDFVFNTHSHADHIQGNRFFALKGASIYADERERFLIENPSMESFYLYGANPPKALKRSFFEAKESQVKSFSDFKMSGFEFVPLPGHSVGMTGIRFGNVLFCGDAYFGEEIVKKYLYPYLINVKEFINSIEKIENSNMDLYIPSHGQPSSDPSHDIKATKDALNNFISMTFDLLKTPKSVEEICFEMNVPLNFGTFYLFRSFESAILSYLEEKGEISNISYGKWAKI
ncbi:MBL fold metallo-hydrolase [Athalassotoga saccharophila]|uniref:MBL fold metallo-hydrolase n=1 Tax=Athalassotoga saccharophila TaxID=1441386 RepID=UPI001379BA80|nr:MBL fold metallo-hydrolase [Athalassotoga saccharophila]BBJ27659.1 hydroxyacylglutathione hydrolase [Athalassotoga saccharophila]